MYLGEKVVREKEYRSAMAETRLWRVYEILSIGDVADSQVSLRGCSCRGVRRKSSLSQL